jgi:hypothetical protein
MEGTKKATITEQNRPPDCSCSYLDNQPSEFSKNDRERETVKREDGKKGCKHIRIKLYSILFIVTEAE